MSTKHNDWKCPKCNVMIFGSKDSCRKCSSKRPSDVQVRDGDWECPKCNIIIFASREACRKCSSKRPEQWQCVWCPRSNRPPTYTSDTCKVCGKTKEDTKIKLEEDKKARIEEELQRAAYIEHQKSLPFITTFIENKDVIGTLWEDLNFRREKAIGRKASYHLSGHDTISGTITSLYFTSDDFHCESAVFITITDSNGTPKHITLSNSVKRRLGTGDGGYVEIRPHEEQDVN